MGLLILLVMVLVPIIEICVFLQAEEWIGLWPTIGMVVITAMIGSTLLRHQGLSTLFNVKKKMDAGRLPIDELFDGFYLLIAGALLITPGFVTDGFGLILFFPIFRNIIRSFIGKRFNALQAFNFNIKSGFEQKTDHTQDPTIIDGEFHEIRTNNDDDHKMVNAEKPLNPPRT